MIFSSGRLAAILVSSVLAVLPILLIVTVFTVVLEPRPRQEKFSVGAILPPDETKLPSIEPPAVNAPIVIRITKTRVIYKTIVVTRPRGPIQ